MLNIDRGQLIRAGEASRSPRAFARAPLFAALLGANPFTLGVAGGES